MQIWHSKQARGVPARLKALRAIPELWSANVGEKDGTIIDAAEIVECLWNKTELVEMQGFDPLAQCTFQNKEWAENVAQPEDMQVFAQRHRAADLFLHYAKSYSLAYCGPTAQAWKAQRANPHDYKCPTSWCGIASAGYLYMFYVMGMAHTWQPTDSRLIRPDAYRPPDRNPPD